MFAISRKGSKIEYVGREQYDIALWAQNLRLWQRVIPIALGAMGVDAHGLAKRTAGNYPMVIGMLLGVQYGFVRGVTSFTSWEIIIAKAIYWVGVPVGKFAAGIFFVALWQHVIHRFMHTNKFLYSRVHSVHHRLYIPFAYGALYNHPFEGFLLDTLGAILAAAVARLSVRQNMLFLVISTVKTTDDHCGYAFPWDPLQLATPNNATYHDIHHQDWGIKTNFLQPYWILWDWWLGTEWKGDTAALRLKDLEKAKKDAANKG